MHIIFIERKRVLTRAGGVGPALKMFQPCATIGHGGAREYPPQTINLCHVDIKTDSSVPTVDI